MVGLKICPVTLLLLMAFLGALTYARPSRESTGINLERFGVGEEPQRYSDKTWATRKISQRALQGIDLFAARGYGKREDCSGRLCSRRMGLTGARLYGKRNASVNQFKCFFMDCRHLEGRIEEMSFYPNSLDRRTSSAVLMPDD